MRPEPLNLPKHITGASIQQPGRYAAEKTSIQPYTPTCMATNGAYILFIGLLIASSQAFQAPLPASLGRLDSLERARARLHGTPTLPPRTAIQRRSLQRLPEMNAGVTELVRPAIAVSTGLPPKSTSMSRSTLLGAAAFVVLMKVYQVGASVTPVSWTLLLHGLAGALGGLVAVVTDSTIFEASEQALQGLWHSMKFTAISTAFKSITFAYLQEAAAALSLGMGGIVLPATGSGVVVTLIQGLFTRQCRGSFFQENVGRNVLLLNTFWFTYFGICAISPAIPVTYTGVGVAGALASVVSSAAHSVGFSWKNLRHAWAKLRQSFRQDETWRGGLQSGVLFVVYQAVYSALASA